ncbi:MAG: hypothetical protein AAGD14_13110 [Planctomycetota bacterium]
MDREDFDRIVWLDQAAESSLLATAVLRPAGGRPGDRLLRYQWPVPSRGRVEEAVRKGPNDGIVTYDVELGEPDGGGVRRLTLSNLEFVINGVAQRPPPEVADAVPDVLVAADGSFEALEGLDRVQRALRAVDGEEADPQLLEALERTTARFWDAWCGTWIHLDPREMDGIARPARFVMPGHVAVPTLATMSCERGDRWHLRAEASLEGEAADEALPDALARIAGSDTDIPRGFRYATRLILEAWTDPETLRPDRVRVEQTAEVADLERDHAGEAIEQHDYRFTWHD